jgi:hypothetical protein
MMECPNKSLFLTQTTLRYVCAAQLGRSQAALYGNKLNTDARETINSILNVLRARRAACERPELNGVHSLAGRRFPPANQTFEPNYPGGGQTSLPATGIIPLNSGRWAA